jgi:hypothetical protein
MANILPSIGTTGIYRLTAPFDTKLHVNVPYTCIAIRRLSDLVNSGIDPLNSIYTANSLVEAVYVQDVKNEVSVLSLQSPSGHMVYVPNSYLAGYPDISGVRYATMAIGVNLGAIPESVNLTALQQKFISTAREYLGVTAEASIVALSEPVMVSETDSHALEAARQSNIDTIVTDYSKFLAKQAQLDTALAKIAELEAFIEANH